jgi:CTP synthase (UTP-ammonia lyase)
MGLSSADTAEDDPSAEHIVVAPVTCAVPNRQASDPKLVGTGRIKLIPETKTFQIYQRSETDEEYFCNYEVNPTYEARLESAGVRIAARGPNGEVRAVELPAHRFFLATLFQPQRSSAPNKPHPLVMSFVQAAARFHEDRQRGIVAGH